MDNTEENNNVHKYPADQLIDNGESAEDINDPTEYHSEAAEQAREEIDSGIDPEDSEANLQFSDKASFREQASSFLRVLEESSKFRQLPEPKGQKPGRLREMPSPRSMENTPQSTPRPLARSKATPVLKADESMPPESLPKSRYAQYDAAPRAAGPVRSSVLPPVAGGGPARLVGGAGNGLAYSRQGRDMLASVKLAPQQHNSMDAQSPRLRKNEPPMKKQSGRISLDTQDLTRMDGNKYWIRNKPVQKVVT